MVFIVKFDGRKEDFDRQKIVETCKRAGASHEAAERIADKISGMVYEGMTTREIYDIILKELARSEKKAALAYSLREAVARLDPVAFEIYVKKILEAHGYTCEYNRIINGLCVEHQVDIIASNERDYLIECKRHMNPHRFCGLGVCLQVQARLEDLEDGFAKNRNGYDFNYAWIITNTKFSEHAKKYAKAKNIRLTGWKYPEGEGFENLIDSKKVYPVSVINAKQDVLHKLIRNNIITVQDISDESLGTAGISISIANRIMQQKRHILD